MVEILNEHKQPFNSIVTCNVGDTNSLGKMFMMNLLSRLDVLILPATCHFKEFNSKTSAGFFLFERSQIYKQTLPCLQIYLKCICLQFQTGGVVTKFKYVAIIDYLYRFSLT